MEVCIGIIFSWKKKRMTLALMISMIYAVSSIFLSLLMILVLYTDLIAKKYEVTCTFIFMEKLPQKIKIGCQK